jgi:MFS family permease
LTSNEKQRENASEQPAGKARTGAWATYLAINSSTGALLGAILLVCMGSEVWGPFTPMYMKGLQEGARKHFGQFLGGFLQDQGTMKGLVLILAIAVYGSFRDLLEAINYYMGGWIAGRFNTRRGLLLFNATPLIGLTILMFWQSMVAVFIAIPFVFVWDSLAGPALLTVVGDSLPPDRRAMAFSLQSLMRRMSRVVAYGISACVMVLAGKMLGMHIAFGISMAAVLASLFIQWRYMKTASKDKGTVIHNPLKMLRSLDPQLKRLLAADIFARLAEGMPRELLVIFGSAAFVQALGFAEEKGIALYGAMLIVSQVTSAITYLPMGAIASRPGFGKRPYIGWTFFFFASFPAILAGAGWLVNSQAVPGAWAVPVMVVAFIFMGMREIGEPARKAMIVDLIPPAQKTQMIGLYWSARCVAVMLAPIVGGIIWVGANMLAGRGAGDPAGPGPYAMLLASSLCGTVGVFYYYARFGKTKGAAGV